MSLLIDIRKPEWLEEQALADLLAPALPGVRIHVGAADGPLDGVTTLATSQLDTALLPRLPSLQLIQKLGAGVETMLSVPDLPPHIRVARLKAEEAAGEIAEYCLAYVLAGQRNMRQHMADEARLSWNPLPPIARAETTVAVLGLGHIGRKTAEVFAALGFRTLGWSRSAKTIAGATALSGAAGLHKVLTEADYVCAILPSTPETRDLFDAGLLARMKPGATLINCGRGDLIVEADLVSALDQGRPAHAVLDVFRTEPLPKDHPFWTHRRVTVTPHVSGWRTDKSLLDVAENYRRLSAGEALLNEVDRSVGY